LLRALFAPCSLAAAAMLGQAGPAAYVALALFVAGACILVFLRDRSYYETAVVHAEQIGKIREAIKSGDLGAVYAPRRNMRRGAAGARPMARAYTIRPFGTGAAALAWAHLAVTWKSPVRNLVLPFAAGAGLSVGACLFATEHAPVAVGGVVAYVVLLVMAVAGQSLCRRAVTLQPLIRPLPPRPWRIVAADLAPAVLAYSCFGWGAGLGLLADPTPLGQMITAVLLFTAPVVIFIRLAIQYALTFCYPNYADKLQQMLSGLIGMAATGVSVVIVLPFVLIPLAFRAPAWLTFALVFVACAGVACAWFFIATFVYTRYQPQEGESTRSS
jgi:hypothetical protein